MLTKQTSNCTTDNFRSLSLLNSHLKNSSNFLALGIENQLKSFKEIPNSLSPKSKYQHSNVTSQIINIKIGERNRILVELSKAFDKRKREYMVKILDKIGCQSILKKKQTNVYKLTKLCNENNGHYVSFMPISNGIMRGCPPSAPPF